MLTDCRAEEGTTVQGSLAVRPARISTWAELERSILNLTEITGKQRQCEVIHLYC